MISEAAINKMPAVQIRDVIREYHHHIFHLERSQRELKAALDAEPADRDFMFAILENNETIALKREAIEKLERRLAEIDVAFCKEEVAISRQSGVRDSYVDISQTGEASAVSFAPSPRLLDEDDEPQETTEGAGSGSHPITPVSAEQSTAGPPASAAAAPVSGESESGGVYL